MSVDIVGGEYGIVGVQAALGSPAVGKPGSTGQVTSPSLTLISAAPTSREDHDSEHDDHHGRGHTTST